MISRSIAEIQEMLGQEWLDTQLPLDHSTTSRSTAEAHDIMSMVLTGVSTDSRAVSNGNLYIPLIGDHHDGHTYVTQAIELGASAVLWQADHQDYPTHIPVFIVRDTLRAIQQLARSYRQQLPVTIIAITGSNGKTTTKDILASLLSTTYRVHKTKGNLNNHIGLPLTILGIAEDTEFAVVEMGMSASGEIALLSNLAQPDAVIITMIGEAHMLQLGSREAITQAKLEILQGMQTDGLFVYHGDEPLLQQAVAGIELPHTWRIMKFGRASHNDFYPTSITLEAEGTTFALNQANYPQLMMPLLGEHNVINALAAIATASYFQITPTRIQQGLQAIQQTSMRIEKIQAQAGYTVLHDAYNASPSSMHAALDFVAQCTGYRKKIVVLGDMLELGDQEIEYHREIGKRCSPSQFDYLFTYGKLAQQIAAASHTTFPYGHVQAFTDKELLIEAILHIAERGDVILVKGSRGMRLEEVVKSMIATSDI